MAIKVNPPPFLRIPKAFADNGEIQSFIEQQNTILFQLYNQAESENISLDDLIEIVNGIIQDLADLIIVVENNTTNIATNTTNIAANTTNIATNADNIAENAQDIDELAKYAGLQSQIQFLQQQIDGLPEFTIDTTGFTVDSTLITVDKVTA